MQMSITQFKAMCHEVVGKVRKENLRVTITRHGRPAAELVPVSDRAAAALFGRSRRTTLILGDLTGTGDHWRAGD